MADPSSKDADKTLRLPTSHLPGGDEYSAEAIDDGPTRVLSPTQTADGQAPANSPDRELVGERVGKILILDVLGVGGMGRVYSGWDEKLERRVALKSIRRRHAPNHDIKARFLQEAQILSRLQHANICQIYDYIEGEDSDFLVLELIEGNPLSDIEPEALDAEARLKIALQLADVLAAAHESDVVHRDLKPANVMVTPEGNAKMLDFGIASSVSDRKAPIVDGRGTRLDVKRSDSSVETEAGFVVGTPQYMSPEQARGERASPSSDMYSFGLLLQELFTGKPPYDPKMSTMQLLVAVQEGRTDPVTGLDPELTALIMRLKSPAPGARPSARDAEQQLRYIQETPRRKRRERLRLTAIAGLAIIALAMTFQAFRIRQESNRAKEAAVIASREAETTKQVLDFLLSLFQASDPWQSDSWKEDGSNLTVREVLERSLGRMETELADQPLIRARLQTEVGIIHRNLWLLDEAQPLLKASLETRREAEAGDLAIAQSLMELGNLKQLQGDFNEGAEMQRQALEMREQADADPDALSDSLFRLGTVYSEMGRLEEAEQLLNRAVEIRFEAFGENDPMLASSLHSLGNIDGQLGRLELAEKRLQRSLAIRENLFGAEHPTVARTLNNLGITYDQTRQWDKALEAYRRALAIMKPRLPADEPQVAVTHMNLGISLGNAGEPEAAAESYKRALEAFRSRLGEHHPRVGEALGNLGVLNLNEGHFELAQGYLEEAKPIFEKAFGESHPSVAMCTATIARADLILRRWDRAQKGFKQALEIFSTALGEEHSEVANTANNLATSLARGGQHAAAQEAAAQAVAVAEKAFPENHPRLGITFITAGEVERRAGQFERADSYLARAAQIFEAPSEDAKSNQRRSRLWREQAHSARDQGNIGQALTLYEQAGEALADLTPDHYRWISQWQGHASALRLAGRDGEAEELERKARQLAASFGIDLKS